MKSSGVFDSGCNCIAIWHLTLKADVAHTHADRTFLKCPFNRVLFSLTFNLLNSEVVHLYKLISYSRRLLKIRRPSLLNSSQDHKDAKHLGLNRE